MFVTRFGPGTPETGPNRVFALKTPPSYVKRVSWVHPAWPARRSFWVCIKSGRPILAPQGPKNGQNGPFRAISGKNRINGCDATEISVILPVGIFRIDSQTARLRLVFCRKPVFTRRRARIHGASGTKLPFRCNSLRRSTPTGPKGRKAPSGPFGPLGQPARFARRLDNFVEKDECSPHDNETRHLNDIRNVQTLIL